MRFAKVSTDSVPAAGGLYTPITTIEEGPNWIFKAINSNCFGMETNMDTDRLALTNTTTLYRLQPNRATSESAMLFLSHDSLRTRISGSDCKINVFT